jgi:NTP pyrophosphatase (non-canonical NTP hydrolase)
MNRAEIQVAIEKVAEKADSDYGDFASMHEALGVLLEEVVELVEAVRRKQSDAWRAQSIECEAIDIAAVAMRIAEQARRVYR